MMTPFASDVYPDEKHAVLSPCSSKVNIAFFVVAYANDNLDTFGQYNMRILSFGEVYETRFTRKITGIH